MSKKHNRKPRLYILPGWGEKVIRKNYQELIAIASDRYEIVPLLYVSKKGQFLSKNIKLVETQIRGATSRDTILGFSVGALIAYKLSTRYKFRKAILCSISDLLERDLLHYPKAECEKLFTHEEMQEMNKMTYGTSKSPSVFMYAAKEGKLIKRTQKLYLRSGGIMIEIGNHQHSLTGLYLDTAKRFI